MFLLRITIFIILACISLAQSAFCADYRVKDIILDNSDKMVIIKGQGKFNTPNPSAYIPVPTGNNNSVNLITNITTFTITAPARYVIDIPNASLVGGGRNFKMNNSSVIQNIQLGQFSSNPDVVRIVFTLNKASDFSKFKTYTNGSDIIVKYNNSLLENSLQYKFYTTNGDTDKKAALQNNWATLTYNNSNNSIDLIPTFQTRYHLSQVSQNSDGLILRGIGQISLQKASYSPDNTKATLILDSTSIGSKINGKSYNIPSSKKDLEAILTIDRINAKKVKLTLNGESLRDYRFVISPDGQSLFISHRSYIINTIFSSNAAVVNSYKFSQTDAGYKLFDMTFNKSVAYDVFELNGNFYLDINNLGDYNIPLFEQTFKNSGINIQALKISSDKTRFIIPMQNLNFAYANVESNSKSIKLCFKEKPVEIEQKPEEGIIIATNTKDEKLEKDKTENINVIYVPKEEKPEKIEKPKKKRENPTISSMKKVVLDPGHGGADSGAIGGGIFEKDINLKVSKLVQERLMKKDVYVYMTRTKDETLTLEDRVNYSNEINPDIYVSIHTNSTVKEDSYGIETHYYKDNSLNLAETIHKTFASNRNLKKWDTLDRGVIKSRFYVINHTEAPSVLMEIGFLSNLEERSKLITEDRQEEIANAIAKGILEYLKVK